LVSGQIVSIPTAEGPLLVEAELALLPDGFAADAGPEDLVRTIERLVAAVYAGLAKAAPTEFTVEAGLKLTGETGKVAAWVIGKSTAEATIKLTAKWTKPAPSPRKAG
jgi:hypothetical protein